MLFRSGITSAGTIQVTAAGRSVTSSGTFDVPDPVPTGITPTSGYGGDATVTVSGTYFTGATSVQFSLNGVDYSAASVPSNVTETSLTADLPTFTGVSSTTTGPLYVKVTTPSGTGTGSQSDFTYYPPEADPRLATLTSSVGTLTPSFNRNTTAYTLTVPAGDRKSTRLNSSH